MELDLTSSSQFDRTRIGKILQFEKVNISKHQSTCESYLSTKTVRKLWLNTELRFGALEALFGRTKPIFLFLCFPLPVEFLPTPQWIFFNFRLVVCVTSAFPVIRFLMASVSRRARWIIVRLLMTWSPVLRLSFSQCSNWLKRCWLERIIQPFFEHFFLSWTNCFFLFWILDFLNSSMMHLLFTVKWNSNRY